MEKYSHNINFLKRLVFHKKKKNRLRFDNKGLQPSFDTPYSVLCSRFGLFFILWDFLPDLLLDFLPDLLSFFDKLTDEDFSARDKPTHRTVLFISPKDEKEEDTEDKPMSCFLG